MIMPLKRSKPAWISLVILVIIFLLCSLPYSVCAKPVALVATEGRIPLAGRMELLHDRTGTLNLDQIRSGAISNTFQPLPGDIATGFTKGALWLRFTLVPRSDAPSLWLLEIDPPINEDLRLYTANGHGQYQMEHLGNLAPKSRNKTAYHNPLFRLQLQPGRSQTCYLRISSQRAIMAKPVLWQPEQFQEASVKMSLFHGLYAGCALVIITINLIFWIRLRRAVYGFYILYILGLLTLFAESNGYLFQFVFTDNPWLSVIALRLSLALIIASGAGFLSELLQLRTRFPRIDRLFCSISYGIALISALFAFTPLRYQIGQLLYPAILASALFSITIASYLAFRKVPVARLYLVAFSPALLSGLYAALINLGIAPHYSNFIYLLLLSTMLHMVLLNIAVADRVGGILAEKKIVEAALSAERQTVEQQCQFVRLISHELRTPLAIINSTAQVLPLLQNDPPLLFRKAEAIQAATRRLAAMLDSCLNVERLALEGLKPEYTVTRIKDIIRSTCEQTQLLSTNHRILVEMDKLQETFRCDAMLIEVLVSNLLDNAVKYSPAGGDISLRAWSDPQGNLFLEVWDSGIGISPEQCEKIFHRFYRGGQLPGVSGAGLGLYLARQIAEMHGGTINCHSEPGHGSIFTVKLAPPAT